MIEKRLRMGQWTGCFLQLLVKKEIYSRESNLPVFSEFFSCFCLETFEANIRLSSHRRVSYTVWNSMHPFLEVMSTCEESILCTYLFIQRTLSIIRVVKCVSFPFISSATKILLSPRTFTNLENLISVILSTFLIFHLSPLLVLSNEKKGVERNFLSRPSKWRMPALYYAQLSRCYDWWEIKRKEEVYFSFT